MVRIFVAILFLSVGLISCNDKSKNVIGDVLLFPENTQVIYRINHKENFLSAIENNEFWKESNPKPIRSYQAKLIRSLPNNHNIWLAFTAYKNFFAIAKKDETDTLSIWKNANNSLQKQNQFGHEWYYTLVDNRLIISNSPKIKNVFKEADPTATPTDNQQILEQLQRIASTDNIANLFIRKEQANQFFQPFFKNDVTRNFKDWLALDLFLEENDIRLSGMAIAESTETQSDKLINTQPFENKIAKVIPSHILSVTSFTFEEAEKIALPYWESIPFQKTLNGLAFIRTIDGQIAITSSFDTDQTLLQLPIVSEYPQSEYPLYELNNDPSLDFFTAFAPDFRPTFVSVYDDYLFFSKTIEVLTSVMNEVGRKNTLSNNKTYQLLEKNIASKVTTTRIVNLYDNSEFASKYPKISKNYRWVAFQQTPQNEYYMFSFSGKRQTQASVTQQMKERFCFSANADFITPPTILTNHRTKRREVAIQDENYDLYLIGNNGSLLWKKRLDGKIQSPIYQVDLFKNGFLQMAFTTEKSIWVIDRNGNVVAPFPKKYKGKITPMEVFDYDKNREYRFLFAENKSLIMLDKKGNIVGGFLRKNTDATPLFTPKHYRAGDKDFLVYIADNGKFHILRRNGETRIPIDGKFKFSNNAPIFFDNRFLFSTKNGNIIRVDLNGNMSVTKKELSPDHYLIGNSFTTSYLSNRTLSIGSKLIELPRGEYDVQKLFRIRGVNYVSAYNFDKDQIYLWDEKGTLLEGFPIRGKSQIDMDVDLDKNVWIAIAQTKTNLCVYEARELK